MAKALTDMKCKPCEEGVPPIDQSQAKEYIQQLSEGWSLTEENTIHRKFEFQDFKEAMQFVNDIAEVAEQEGHHPDIYIFYNLVEITLFTHAIDGLSENDFIVAAKIDQVVQ